MLRLYDFSPELSEWCQTSDERESVLREIDRRGSIWLPLTGGIFAVALLVAWPLVLNSSFAQLAIPSYLYGGRHVFALAAAVAILHGVKLLYNKRSRRTLRTVLRERGHAICIACGYRIDHVQHDGDQCPECGWCDPE